MTARETSSPQRRLQELKVPYWFSSTARRRQEELQIGDYVQVSGLRDQKCELVDIMWKFGSVRVRQVGRLDSMTMPWRYVVPWEKKVIRSETVMRAVGGWLFGRNLVYRLSEPGRMLKQRRIHWDRETCDVEDEDGRVIYGVPWDDLEFVDDIEFHLPDD